MASASSSHDRPLQLQQYATLKVAALSQLCKKSWVKEVRESLPTTVLIKVLFLIEIASFSTMRYIDEDKITTVIGDILSTAINCPIELHTFEVHILKADNQKRLANLILEFQPFLRLPICHLVRSAHKIMLNHSYLLRFIIKRLTNIYLLNNLMILSVAYNRKNITRFCVKYGADDFVSGLRIAILTDVSGETEQYFEHGVSRSERSFHLQEISPSSYRIYHQCMTVARNGDSYFKFLASEWLHDIVEQDDPFHDMSIYVEDLYDPMVSWPEDSLFKVINYMTLNQLAVIRERHWVSINAAKKNVVFMTRL